MDITDTLRPYVPYNHVMSAESRDGVICKTISVSVNSSMTFTAAWIVSSVTIASATLDATSQTNAFNKVFKDEPEL